MQMLSLKGIDSNDIGIQAKLLRQTKPIIGSNISKKGIT